MKLLNPESPDITRDYFFREKVIVYQHKKGYRFSVDAPILADFLPSCPWQQALDIGTGVGIIALLALYKKKFSYIHGLEIQPGLSELAALNAAKNDFADTFGTESAKQHKIILTSCSVESGEV